MVLALRKGLDSAGFQSVRIHMPDPPNLAQGIQAVTAIQQSPAAWKAVDYTATHVYDVQDFYEEPDGYDARIAAWKGLAGDKPFLSTELTVNHGAYQSRSYRVAFAQAQLYHKSMALMDAASLNYCWTLLDVEQPSFAATRSLFAVDRADGFVPAASSYQLRVFGAFSRRLREGMVRVEAESRDPDVLVTGYESAGGMRTVIVLNRSLTPREIRIEWPGAVFREVEIAGPYQANEVRAEIPAPLILQPGEIATVTNVPLGGKR
jgi:hypothetical protein